MSFAYDDDTRLEPCDGGFAITPTAAWNIGKVPNGGYLLSMMGRAALARSRHAEVLDATIYFLRPGASDTPALIEVEALKERRRISLYSVRLLQGGKERARATIICGDLDAQRGRTEHFATRPEIAPPAECQRLSPEFPMVPVIMERVELLLDPAYAAFLRGQKGRPEHRAWMRFTDDRPVDTDALLLFADTLPPTSFNTVGMATWVPTLQLNVQLRGRPKPDAPIGISIRSRHFTDGHFEQDGTLWSEGELVAVTRQRALLL